MKIELTAEDRALDVRKEYEDTRIAIEFLKNSRLEVPEEAGVMLSLMKRCIAAEETIAAIAKRTEQWCRHEGQCGEAESALRSCFAWSHGGSIAEYLDTPSEVAK